MEPYECRVLADSVYQTSRLGVPGVGPRLTTLLVCFPRFVLAEFNTHRVFSRNSASSRAVPVDKRIAAVRARPFVPEAFGRNRPGMRATEDLLDTPAEFARDQWLAAAADACDRAEALASAGVHKQLANRVLEPYLWHEVVVTATEWSNFWNLRCHPAAQPEMRRAAEAMRAAYEASAPRVLSADEWHLPFIDEEDVSRAEADVRAEEGWEEEGWRWRAADRLVRISSARCARVSYLTHDGRRAPEEDLRLHGQLLEGGHMSPFEHPARPFSAAEQRSRSSEEFEGNFRGWVQYRKLIPREADRLAPGAA